MTFNSFLRSARSAAIGAVLGGFALGLHPTHAADANPAPAAPPFLPGGLTEDDTGFKPIFDGKSLEGWDGDPKLWGVKDSVIVGEIPEQATLKAETFLIWHGGELKDFELKAEYRVSDKGNSGLSYRGTETPGTPWTLAGYQMDIDGRAWGAGFNERVLKKNGLDCPRITGQSVGRVILALPGQVSIVSAQQMRRVVGSLGSCAAVTQELADGWNKTHLIVRGNLMIHIINGQVMSVVIDEDPARAQQGRIGLQLHPGGAMKVEFRNIRIKTPG